MEDKDYGLLLRPSDIKLQRTYFKQMTSLLGVNVVYRAPRPDKHYTVYTEIDSNYMAPEIVGCIFEEHPEQQTLKKLGWMAELQEDASIKKANIISKRKTFFIINTPLHLDNHNLPLKSTLPTLPFFRCISVHGSTVILAVASVWSYIIENDLSD